MATSYENIYSRFLTSVRDYKLDALYAKSEDDFYSYLNGFLIRCLTKFNNCKQDLSKRNDSIEMFTANLDDLECDILADLMVLEWLEKEINDVSQMNLHLQGRDFKTYAESQNLDKKKEHRNELKEQVSQRMTEYGLKSIPWSDWAMGNFQ